MKCYCTKCNINWSCLLPCDYEGEEQTEVCPVCLTDMFLTDGKDEPVYFMCAITAKVLSVETKKELERATPIITEPVYQPYIKPDYHAIADRELKAILAYHRTGNREDYFKEFK